MSGPEKALFLFANSEECSWPPFIKPAFQFHSVTGWCPCCQAPYNLWGFGDILKSGLSDEKLTFLTICTSEFWICEWNHWLNFTLAEQMFKNNKSLRTHCSLSLIFLHLSVVGVGKRYWCFTYNGKFSALGNTNMQKFNRFIHLVMI